MTSPPSPPPKRAPTYAFEAALGARADLCAAEREFVRAALTDPQLHPVGATLPSAANRIVLGGWVGWTAQLEDGRRQILGLALAGDLLDHVPVTGLSLSHVALSTVHTADASALEAGIRAARPELGGLGRAWELAQAAAREQAVRHALRLGRLAASERLADLLIELHERQRLAGLADHGSMPLPLTQEVLADVLGLSVVHVNRVLQQLRREALISYRGGRVRFLDGARLARAAGRG